MSKSGLLCYYGPVSALCCAKSGRRSGIRFTTKITMATKENSFLLLFVIFATFVVTNFLSQKRIEKPLGLPEKFRGFFEKYSHFNVKFRKFFGYFFCENSVKPIQNPVQPVRPLKVQGIFMQILANEQLAKLRHSGQSPSVQVGKTSLERIGLTAATSGLSQLSGSKTYDLCVRLCPGASDARSLHPPLPARNWFDAWILLLMPALCSR
jgi:hypothetical protein